MYLPIYLIKTFDPQNWPFSEVFGSEMDTCAVYSRVMYQIIVFCKHRFQEYQNVFSNFQFQPTPLGVVRYH